MMGHHRIRLALGVYVVGVMVVSLLPSSGASLWHLDKIGHFAAYGGMAFLALLGYRSMPVRVAALVAAVALGGALEWAQLYVPGRDMSFVDACANTAGVVSGAFLYRWRLRILPE